MANAGWLRNRDCNAAGVANISVKREERLA